MRNQFNELEFYKKLIFNMPVHVYWKDINGKYLGCNKLQANDAGFSDPEEIIGKTDYDIHPKDHADLLKKIDQIVIDNKKALVVEEPLVTKNGLKTMYLSEKVPLLDNSNNVIGILGISFDISRQKLNEVVLDNILENFPGHIYWKDVKGEYLGCNKMQATSLGYENRFDLVGKTDFDLSSKEIANKIFELDREIILHRKTVCLEETTEDTKGELRYFVTGKLPLINQLDKVIGIIGISIDITDRKRAEKFQEMYIKQLKKEIKIAEAKIKSLQMTAAAIAHEMRTPMRTVDTCASGLADYLPALLKTYQMAKQHQLDVPPIPEQLIKNLTQSCEAIRFEVRETFNIIDMLLMNARLKNLEQIELSVCSIKANIETALSRYTFDQQERELIHWQSEQDFLYLGNEILTIHVMFNLLKNALWQIKKAGKGEIFIQIKTTKKFNILKFKDTAAGIDPEILPKIFQQFFSQTTHGTGVGLAFCEMVFKRYHGEISCQSKLGEYAEFIMKFPKIESA